MMDLNTIRKLNEAKGREAKRKGILPLSILDKKDKSNLKKMAFIGDHRPKGYNLINEYFVDSSGFGAVVEPALTFEQFESKVKEGHAYAIIEAGLFQVWIAEFVMSNTIKKKQKKLRKKLQKIEEGIRFFRQEKQDTQNQIIPPQKDDVVVYQEEMEIEG